MGKDEGEDKVTMTRKELSAFVADEVRKGKMPKEERRLRDIIREEVASVLGETFKVVDDDDDDDDDDEREGEGGLLKAVGSFLGGGSEQ